MTHHDRAADPVASVFLIPTKGDPYGLLWMGPCGFQPPRAHRFTCDQGHQFWLPGTGYTAVVCCPCGRGEDSWADQTDRALVLKWNGDVQLPGCWIVAGTLAWQYGNHLRRVYLTADFMALLHVIRQSGLGQLVFLDSTGKEIP